MRVKITGQNKTEIHAFEFTDFTTQEAIEHVMALGYDILQCTEDGRYVRIKVEDEGEDDDVSNVV